MKIYAALISFPLLCILLACSPKTIQQVEKFSAEKPYAINIAKERSYFQAKKVSNRITQLGFQSYIIQNKDTAENDGFWFYILYGAIAEKDSAKKLNKYLQQKIKLQQLKIVNYNNFKDAVIDISTKEIKEIHRISSIEPKLSNDVYLVTEKFPESNSLYIKKLSIINSPKDPKNKVGYSIVYYMNMDLPRGISRKKLLEETSSFAEVTYGDNLYGDKIVIGIGKLRVQASTIRETSLINAENNKQFEIASEYADLVLNTGDYITEEKKEIKIQSYTLLKGYRVTIEPKTDQLRTYLILVDKNLEYVIFSQSTHKTKGELVEILSGIGKGKGLIEYDEFYNTFYTIPATPVENDLFIGFNLDKLDANYVTKKGNTKWAKEMVGHWQATGYFNNKKKGSWSYSIFDLLNSEEQEYIYKTLYLSEKTKNKNNIDVYGTKGILVTTPRFDWKTFKSKKIATEINFGIGRYICAIDNSKKSKLSKKDLHIRAEALQLKKRNIKDIPKNKKTIQ